MAEAMGSLSAAGSRSCPRTCCRFQCRFPTAAFRSEPRLLPPSTKCSIAAGTSGTKVGTGRCWGSHWLLPFRWHALWPYRGEPPKLAPTTHAAGLASRSHAYCGLTVCSAGFFCHDSPE